MTDWFIYFFHLNIIATGMHALAIPTLWLLAWFFVIRYTQTNQWSFLILAGLFVFHSLSLIPVALHRYEHLPIVRAIYRSMFFIVIFITWGYFVKYWFIFVGRTKKEHRDLQVNSKKE